MFLSDRLIYTAETHKSCKIVILCRGLNSGVECHLQGCFLVISVQMTDRTWLSSIVMAMVFLAFLLPVVATATPFPRDLQPISVVGQEGESHDLAETVLVPDNISTKCLHGNI